MVGSRWPRTYQAVAQTQSRCLIAVREHPRAGIKQMAMYQAVVAQTQSSSSSSNMCCSVATQTWSAHVACSLLHTIHYASSMNTVWRTPIQCKSQTALLLLLYIFFRTRSSSMLAALLSLPLFFPPLTFSTKDKMAKLKGLLRVQPNVRRKDEPQRGFISVRYYEVSTVLVSLYFGFQICVRQESSVIRHFRFHQRLLTPPHPLPTHYEIRSLLLLSSH